MKLFFTLLTFLMVLSGCKEVQNNKGQKNDVHKNLLKSVEQRAQLRDSLSRLVQSGDIVLRKGNDFISETLAQLNDRSTAYSHCGIVFVEEGYPFVYHCIGTSDNPESRMRRDSICHFFSTSHNFSIAAYRYSFDSSQLQKVYKQVLAFYRERPVFDYYFNIGNDDELYCAEMLAKAINRSVGPIIMFSLLGNQFYYSVDDLFINPYAYKVGEASFIHEK